MKYAQLFHMQGMKKCAQSVLLALVVVALGAGTLLAQNSIPSSKQTADVNSMVVCKMSQIKTTDVDMVLPSSCTDIFSGQSVSTDKTAWIKIMEKPLKVPASNSIFLNVSLVTGL